MFISPILLSTRNTGKNTSCAGIIVVASTVPKKIPFPLKSNLAKAYAGICYQNLGKYEEAIKALDGFSGDDQMVAPAIQGAIGNCYAQLGQLDKATSALLKAADHADNSTLSPIFLLQAGEILMKQGKNEEAVKAFTKIKDKYFQSYQAMDIDKYIEQAKLLKK